MWDYSTKYLICWWNIAAIHTRMETTISTALYTVTQTAHNFLADYVQCYTTLNASIGPVFPYLPSDSCMLVLSQTSSSCCISSYIMRLCLRIFNLYFSWSWAPMTAKWYKKTHSRYSQTSSKKNGTVLGAVVMEQTSRAFRNDVNRYSNPTPLPPRSCCTHKQQRISNYWTASNA